MMHDVRTHFSDLVFALAAGSAAEVRALQMMEIKTFFRYAHNRRKTPQQKAMMNG